ncbi:UNVERIFIED_CONTAM: hypothetical protein Sradi_0426500 [Sesamum radiatum]|uniref:Uncharacterized protein n=1 Tax=Sesamum radiatum TaxID=300843 RepID=A0AAW2WAQ2_SESRA
MKSGPGISLIPNPIQQCVVPSAWGVVRSHPADLSTENTRLHAVCVCVCGSVAVPTLSPTPPVLVRRERSRAPPVLSLPGTWCVGRRMQMEFQGGRGTCYGWVLVYVPAAGRLKIVYEDGGSEELYSSEVYLLLVSGEPPPSQPLESSVGTSGRAPQERGGIVNEGEVDDSCFFPGSLVDIGGNSSELD